MELNIPISHYGERINFLKFQGTVSCYFRVFIVEWFHFVNDYVQLEELLYNPGNKARNLHARHRGSHHIE